jgi:hypothetical protein
MNLLENRVMMATWNFNYCPYCGNKIEVVKIKEMK